MIGNIIISDKIRVDENFNVVDSVSKKIEGIPTLIVGLDNVKELGVKLNYVDRKLDDLTYWTFSKKEKRNLFEEDLFYFIENSYKKLKNDIEYIFIDFIIFNDKKIDKIFKKIESNTNNITLLNGDMIYTYCEKYLFGFNLKQIEFIGQNPNEFKNKIKSLSSVFLDDEQILIEYKNNLGMLDEEVKYIPVLYSMRQNG